MNQEIPKTEEEIEQRIPEVIVIGVTSKGRALIVEEDKEDGSKEYHLPRGKQLGDYNLQQTAYHILETQTGYFPQELEFYKTLYDGTGSKVIFIGTSCVPIDEECLEETEFSIRCVKKSELQYRLYKELENKIAN